jgi:hypothetical protein
MIIDTKLTSPSNNNIIFSCDLNESHSIHEISTLVVLDEKKSIARRSSPQFDLFF